MSRAVAAPHPRRRRDLALWTCAALLAVGGVVVGVGLAPSSSGAHAAAPSAASFPAASKAIPVVVVAVTDAAEPDRVSAFLSRTAALKPLEAALRRAFAPASAPPPTRRPPPSGRRVARGATPEACLAQAVYYEARGEPAEGQAAVAQVVLNRSRSGVHPTDLCGVVFEGAARPGCQFSFACDGRLGGRRPDPVAWRRAEEVAAATLSGRTRPELDGALNYHADYVRPRWAAGLQRTAEIGRHIFYAAVRPAGRLLDAWTGAPAPPASGA